MRRSGAARSPATLPAPAARPSCGESATRPARQRRPAQSTGRKVRARPTPPAAGARCAPTLSPHRGRLPGPEPAHLPRPLPPPRGRAGRCGGGPRDSQKAGAPRASSRRVRPRRGASPQARLPHRSSRVAPPQARQRHQRQSQRRRSRGGGDDADGGGSHAGDGAADGGEGGGHRRAEQRCVWHGRLEGPAAEADPPSPSDSRRPGAADLPQGRRSVLSTGPCTGPTPTARSSPTSRQRRESADI